MLTHALASVARVDFHIGEDNWRSRKAMEKIGGRLTERFEEIELGGTRVVHVIYEIDREGFAAGPLAREV